MFSCRSISLFSAPLVLASTVILTASAAHAEEPTVAECMMAHDEATELRAAHDLRAARGQLQTCAANSCPVGLRTTCAAEEHEVASSIPTLILDAVDAAGNDVSDVKVTMDGKPLLNRINGSSVAVEPGAHRFVFQVPGQPPEAKTLVMTEGEKDCRVRIEIAPPPPAPSHDGDTRRMIGLVFGAAAVVSAGVATGFGLSARSNLASSKADCVSTSNCMNASLATSELNTANTDATISTAGFIGAGVFLAAGAMLYFTAHPSKASSSSAVNIVPGVGPGVGSLLLRGTF